MHDSFCTRICSENIIWIVEEEDSAVLLGLVLLVRILHVFGEESQVSVSVVVAVEGMVMLVSILDVVVFVHKDGNGIFLVADFDELCQAVTILIYRACEDDCSSWVRA